MNVEEFVKLLKTELVDVSVEEYRELIATTDRSQVTDPTWSGLLELHDSLPEGRREDLVRTMRLVAIDTLSNILGIVDGSSTLPGFHGELSLKCKGLFQAEWAGELQDPFLQLIEEEASASAPPDGPRASLRTSK